MNRAVELIATGSELLNGRTLNTHTRTLARMLEDSGFALARETVLPDDADLLREALSEALARAAAVVVSGGLGPTCDDVTRAAVASLLGRGLREDPAAVRRLEAFCRARGRELSASRRSQALIVEGAEALPNRAGAAPGQLLEVAGRLLFLVPGPPDEFEAVLADGVLPRLRDRFGLPAGQAQRLLLVCGLGESDLCELFAEQAFPAPGVNLAFCASPGCVEIRLAGNETGLIEREAERVRRWCGEAVFAEERVPMEAVVGKLLAGRQASLSVAESCTGGGIGARLTAAPGSSATFRGGLIVYSNDSKQRLLGIPAGMIELEGAVSEAVAGAMASGVRERFRTDLGLAVTGIAGPGGGSEEKPVGLVYAACADAEGVEVRRFLFSGDRERIRDWTTQMALDLVRRRLL